MEVFLKCYFLWKPLKLRIKPRTYVVLTSCHLKKGKLIAHCEQTLIKFLYLEILLMSLNSNIWCICDQRRIMIFWPLKDMFFLMHNFLMHCIPRKNKKSIWCRRFTTTTSKNIPFGYVSNTKKNTNCGISIFRSSILYWLFVGLWVLILVLLQVNIFILLFV